MRWQRHVALRCVIARSPDPPAARSSERCMLLVQVACLHSSLLPYNTHTLTAATAGRKSSSSSGDETSQQAPSSSYHKQATLAFSPLPPPAQPPPRLLLLLLLQLLLSSLLLFLIAASTAPSAATAAAAPAAAAPASGVPVAAGKAGKDHTTSTAVGFQPPFPHTAAPAPVKRKKAVREKGVCMSSSSFSSFSSSSTSAGGVRPSHFSHCPPMLLHSPLPPSLPPSFPPSLPPSLDAPSFHPPQGHHF